MNELIRKAIIARIEQLQTGGVWSDFDVPAVLVERPKDLSHGDWTSNIAFMLAAHVGQAPPQIATMLAERILIEGVSYVVVAGGYINFTLEREMLAATLGCIADAGENYGRSGAYAGQKIMVEYTDPNPFKVFHIGHLMPNVIGESIAQILEFAGAEVKRANYQGDVGRHVAMALWGMKNSAKTLPRDMDPLEQKTTYLGMCYAEGNTAFENDDHAKADILTLNKNVYEDDLSDEEQMLYDKGRAWSLAHFEELYALLGTTFDFYFFESETWKKGKEVVDAHMGSVFTESDGAVVFQGEAYGLHTRVFLNKQGLTTYEAKDLGLAYMKHDTYEADRYIVVTAVEQKQYFQVMYKALELSDPFFVGKMKHIPHGLLQLTTGKMSSRSGNVITGESMLRDAQEIAQSKVSEKVGSDVTTDVVDAVAVAGVKFGILKQSIQKNIVYDQERALSFDGDSGPYLQYTYARACSVLEKSAEMNISSHGTELEDVTVNIERCLAQFPEVVDYSAREYAPHIIAGYLIDLARLFNAFYAQNQILTENTHVAHRVHVTASVAQVLHNGLSLLGIRSPHKM